MYHHQTILEAIGRGGAYKKGLCLRLIEYTTLKELVPELQN